MELTRKLVSFVKNKDKDEYVVDFAYYYDGNWTGTAEVATLTAEQLYEILKPVLKVEIDRWHLKELKH
jgi:hypothetical protein